MIAAVKALPQDILDEVEYREWNLRTIEGVARFMALKAKSLPAVAIDGHIVYQCEIPPQEDLIAAIHRARHEEEECDSSESRSRRMRICHEDHSS